MRELLLGIDIGTSSCKVSVFSREGKDLASETEKYDVSYPHPGWAQQDPLDWWNGVCRAIRNILSNTDISAEEIKGIGIDGQSWSAIAIDRDGKVLFPTPIWMDVRADDICVELNRRIGEDKIFEVSGNALQPSYTTPKVLWYEREYPDEYKKIDKILQSNGYIAYKLTGAVTQDVCQGYGWHCFDMRSGSWDKEMAKELGIPLSFLPEIVNCDTIVGRVTKEAAQESGLMEGTPVVAGGLDAACGTLGAGVINNGDTQEQGGQAGGMSICTDSYHADKRLILSYHVVPNRWLLQGGTTGGGGVMRWFENEFAGEERMREKNGSPSSLVQLNELAEKVGPGCDGLVFLPYMSGERTPIWDPKAKGVFYGIDFSKTKGHFVRACMEGVAFSLRHNLEIARNAGASSDVLRSVGGSANSLLWTQIKADVTGRKIVVPASDTATTLGAAMLAGKAVGLYSSYEEAVKLAVKDIREHEPKTADKDSYDRAYETYLSIYEDLKELMQRS
ncbi:MAG: xylulokinase [Lachnospiraceae bacterium]|nr:xylulokinase [Lachnospiraceae bacterium]